MNPLIRLAEPNEYPIVHSVMREAFEEYRHRLHPPSGALSEELDDIHRKINGGDGGAILVWSGDKPVGSAQYYFRETYMYIGRVSVITEARGLGVAKLIMRELERIACGKPVPETRIEARLSLPRNVEYYARLGYEAIEEHEYPEKTDRWYVMRKAMGINDASDGGETGCTIR